MTTPIFNGSYYHYKSLVRVIQLSKSSRIALHEFDVNVIMEHGREKTKLGRFLLAITENTESV